MKKLKGITRTLVCIGVFIAVAACESTDCPINNIVYSTYGFYAATDEGESKIQVLDNTDDHGCRNGFHFDQSSGTRK